MSITTIKQLIELYQSVFYLEDTSIIPLVVGATIQSKLDGDPVWLFIVGGSSAGKSECINALLGVPFVKQVSTLTENTFLSGMKIAGKETSLLNSIKNGVITFKDFTSILAMPSEKQQTIMAQMREVFDGHMTKMVGNGMKLEWKGKINVIAAVTEAIHVEAEKFNKMGTRNLFYTMPEQDRFKTTRRAMQNFKKIKDLRQKIKDGFAEYVEFMVNKITSDESKFELPEQVVENLLYLTDFVAVATTGVAKNYRGEMELALSKNLPMRNATQAVNLGSVFMAMNDGSLPEWGEKLLYKTALDCIPKQRRMCLTVMSQFREVTTAGLAITLGYGTNLTRSWLEDLTALDVCKRSKALGTDKWKILDDYRALILVYENLKYKDQILTGDDLGVSEDTEEAESEAEIEAQKMFDSM